MVGWCCVCAPIHVSSLRTRYLGTAAAFHMIPVHVDSLVFRPTQRDTTRHDVSPRRSDHWSPVHGSWHPPEIPIAPRYFYFPQLPRKWIKRKMSVCLSAPCKNIRAPAAVKSAGVIEFAKNHKISLRSSLRSHTALLLHLFHLFHLLTF